MVGSLTRRGIWLGDTGQRRDLATFVDRAMRLDNAAVIRLRARSGGLLTAWTGTGLDVLAGRVVCGSTRPGDLCAGAGELARGLAAADDSGYVDPGVPAEIAWRGALPPHGGFAHLDEIPVQVMLDLTQRGVSLARQHGEAGGPPAWLLDQEVIRVHSGDISVGIPMRCVFAAAAMGFLPQSPAGETVRVRALPAWLRIDAGFGSVYRRRGDPPLLS